MFDVPLFAVLRDDSVQFAVVVFCFLCIQIEFFEQPETLSFVVT